MPVAIVGIEKYNWNPFKKRVVEVSIGTPISHELELEQITQQWREQITGMNGYTLTEIKELETMVAMQ